MNANSRNLTINSKGEIVQRPYGSSRWASPKKYACGHTGCEGAARILKPANTHLNMGAHNCCDAHDA